MRFFSKRDKISIGKYDVLLFIGLLLFLNLNFGFSPEAVSTGIGSRGIQRIISLAYMSAFVFLMILSRQKIIKGHNSVLVLLFFLIISFIPGLILLDSNYFFGWGRYLEIFISFFFFWFFYSRLGAERFFFVLVGFFSFITIVAPVFGLLSPQNAFLIKPDYVLGYQLMGVFPVLNANGISLNASLLLFFELFSLFSIGFFNKYKLSANDKMIKVLLILLYFLIVFSTASRTSILSIFVAFLLLFFAKSFVNGIFIKALKVIILTISIPVLLISISSVFERIFLREGAAQLQSMSGRTIFWDKAFEFISMNPLFGSGYAVATRYKVMPSLGFSDISTLHSTYVESLLLGGIFALICLFLFFIPIIWGVSKSYILERSFDLTGAFLVIILLKCFTNTIGIYHDSIWYFFLLICSYQLTINYRRSL